MRMRKKQNAMDEVATHAAIGAMVLRIVKESGALRTRRVVRRRKQKATAKATKPRAARKAKQTPANGVDTTAPAIN